MSLKALIYNFKLFINSFNASGDFSNLQITFTNSLDPDQDRQNVGPDLVPKRLTPLIVFLKEFFKQKANFEEKGAAGDNKGMKNYPACKELSVTLNEVKR